MSEPDAETSEESTATTGCCSDWATNADAERTGRFIDTDDVLAAELPADLQSALGQFLDREPVETLGEWVDVVRELTGGGSIAREELCHAGEQTPHWGDLDGERYHFVCFYDAVILAALADQPVDIHTESPDGTVIEAQAVGSSELTVAPESAVFSFGIDADALTDGEVTVEDMYAAGCPFVKAFPDRDAYERWASEVSAVTVAMPLAGATELAAGLVN